MLFGMIAVWLAELPTMLLGSKLMESIFILKIKEKKVLKRIFRNQKFVAEADESHEAITQRIQEYIDVLINSLETTESHAQPALMKYVKNSILVQPPWVILIR
jgi:hypothetical protein